jgi:glutaredoxin-like protein NrdH
MSVVLYSKPGCVQCNSSERKFKKENIEYVKIDITQDEDAYNRVVELGYAQVPVIETEDGDHWSGYQPEKIEALKPAPAE